MNRPEALSLLGSTKTHERLQAARVLELKGTAADRAAIQAALAVEQTHWVEVALRRALATATADHVTSSEGIPQEEDQEAPEVQIYDQAMREATGLLVHELEPIVGRIRLFGGDELDGESKLAREIERLAACLRAIDRLSRATTPPTLVEFDLAGLLSDLSVQLSDELLDEKSKDLVSIELSGPTPFLVIGDKALIDLAFCNGLRNAVEATLSAAHIDHPRQVVVAWGKSSNHYFIRVLDDGIGLPPGVQRAFDIGTTTKKGHLGMGLPLVARAMETLRGQRALEPREDQGARLTLTWPRPNGKTRDATAAD